MIRWLAAAWALLVCIRAARVGLPHGRMPRLIWWLAMLSLVLATTGCGRRWEQLWGQDTKPETRWRDLVPDQLWDDVRGRDVVQFLDTRLERARFLSVKVCDADSVCVALPAAGVNYLVDHGVIPGLLTVFNLSALPSAERVVVEFVL